MRRASDEPIFEPKADWLPLELAPLHYVVGYTTSAKEWGDQLRKLVDLGVRLRRPQSEYSFEAAADKLETAEDRDRKWAWTYACGITVSFDAHECIVCLEAMEYNVYIHRHPEEFFEDEDWNKLSEPQRSWFEKVVGFVIGRILGAFERSIRTGASHVMARKNTVLAPFERVYFDQWQYFSVDGPICPEPEPQNRINPLY